MSTQGPQDPNIIIGNNAGIDFSSLRAPTPSSNVGGEPQSVQSITNIPTDPSMPLSEKEAQQEKEKLDDEKHKSQVLRLKIYGYYNKLPELTTMVDWPSPINVVNQYTLDQLEELYRMIIDSREVASISGGCIVHNAMAQGMETLGISYGFMVNGFANAVSVDIEARNLQQRLRQLVTILEIEYQMGIKNPLIEYAAIMGGQMMMIHRANVNADRELSSKFQQAETVPSDILNQFSDL